MSLRFTFKNRLLLYLSIIIAVIISSFFWGAPGQSLNLKQARRQIDSVKKELAGDPRFSDLQFLQSTSHLGKRIIVRGSLPDQASLEQLLAVMRQRISPKFEVGYAVDVGDDPVERLLYDEDKK